MGQAYYAPPWDGTAADGLALAQAQVSHIPTTGYGGINCFSINFTKSYIAAGYLKPGRAVIIVSTGWTGSGMSGGGSAAYPFPSPHTTLVASWAADASCSPGVDGVAKATGPLMDGDVTMSLTTHAECALA